MFLRYYLKKFFSLTMAAELHITDRLLVFGYVHNAESEYQLANFPEPLIYILALFFVHTAEWDESLKSEHIMVSDDACIHHEAYQHKNMHNNFWRSIFGKRECSQSGRYEWKFQIADRDFPHKLNDNELTMSNTWHLFIGIMKAELCAGYVETDCMYKGESVGFVGSTARVTSGGGSDSQEYGEAFETKGDTLAMILDLDATEPTLSYVINGTDYGAVNASAIGLALSKSDTYRLAVCVCPNTKLQLLDQRGQPH